MLKITPSPWKKTRISEGDYVRLAVVQDRADDKGLILVTHTFDGVQAEENIQLMATAPELYEALKNLVGLLNSEDTLEIGCHCTDSGEGLIKCVWCKAKETLDKVDGK